MAVVPAHAIATTYDAATRLARATAPLTAADQNAGSVDLLLSIFDQGDGIYDSAALLDNLVVDNRSVCQAGAEVLDATDPQTSARKPKLKFPKPPPDDELLLLSKAKKPRLRIGFSSSEQGSSFYLPLRPARRLPDEALRALRSAVQEQGPGGQALPVRRCRGRRRRQPGS